MWSVVLGRKARKQVKELPRQIFANFAALVLDIEKEGPVRGNWPNYSKLPGRRHHCHIKKGRPTHVAVWEEAPGGVRIVEVVYVGTHEKAPY